MSRRSQILEKTVFVEWTRWLSALHTNSVMAVRANRIAAIISEFPIGECTILDVGSGNGNLAFAIIQMRPDIHIQGVDVLLWPLQKIPTIKFDGKTIPAKDSEWDYCLVSDVLHHCDEPSQLLTELKRASKKGVIVKDHIADSRYDHAVLSFMDWFGNRGHGVSLTYKYWSWERWRTEFANQDLLPRQIVRKLNLYPWPLSWVFDRRLHFIALLEKD